MPEHELPTWPNLVEHAIDALNKARNNMSTARDWLKSDWRPPENSLTDTAADARTTVFTLISTIKDQTDEAKDLLRDSQADS